MNTLRSPIWCDGIDDEIAEAGLAAVENKKKGDISPPNMPVSLHVGERSLTSRDVHQACEAGDGVRRATSLLFRPILRIALCSASSASPLPH